MNTIHELCKKVFVYPQLLVTTWFCVCSLVVSPLSVFADAAAEMQKKLQNPLGE